MDFKALLKASGIFVVVVLGLWFIRGVFNFISKWIVSPGLILVALLVAFFAYKFFRGHDNNDNTNTKSNTNANTNSSSVNNQDDFN